jgi:tetratricopeptide (TPR) repeat protein
MKKWLPKGKVLWVGIYLFIFVISQSDANGERFPNPETAMMLAKSCELIDKGNFDKAEEILQKVLQNDATNPVGLNNLAAIMIKRKQYDKALYYLEKALPNAKTYVVKANMVCDIDGSLKENLPKDLENWEITIEARILNHITWVKARTTRR